MGNSMKNPTVALIGRPNVGKSTLFNKLAKKALALVDDTPGLTRDRKTTDITVHDKTFTLVDTPGLEEATDGSITSRMRAQTEAAVRSADLIVFMVDAQAGVTPMDRHYATWLRQFAKPVLLVASKCDGRNFEAGLHEAYQLGYDEPFGLSAAHNDGVGALKEHIVASFSALFDAAEREAAGDDAAADENVLSFNGGESVEASAEELNWRDKPLHLAIVGRPNAGKSTLVNALLGEERMLVGPEAGLTRDSVHLPLNYNGRAIRLVDTAGMRRRARISDRLEKMAVAESLRTIRLAHVVVLVVDATQPLEKQDLEIARHVLEEGRALVVAVNKWDLIVDKTAARAELQRLLDNSLAQAKAAPLVMLSALKNKGVDKLMQAVLQLEEVWNLRVSTGRLNKWLQGATSKNPPPMVDGRRLKIRYATQLKARPPTFALWLNKSAGDLPGSYQRYLLNSLRDTFNMPGVPVRFMWKKSANPYAD